MAHQLRARRCTSYASANDMAAEASTASARVVGLRRHQWLRHHRAARLAGPRYREPLRLSVARSHRIPLFFSPLAEASSPRNAILGHAIGLICGYAAFAVTSGFGPTFAAQGEVHLPRVLAAALALSTTGALMALFRVNHPPAGATTLIVALGIISQPRELIVIEVAVILLTAQAFAINRIAGIHYPSWRTVSN